MDAIVHEARASTGAWPPTRCRSKGIRASVEAGSTRSSTATGRTSTVSPTYDEALLDAIGRQGIHVSITIVGFMREAYQAFLRDPDGAPLPEALRERYAWRPTCSPAASTRSSPAMPACRPAASTSCT
jgi:hypothetical protein